MTKCSARRYLYVLFIFLAIGCRKGNENGVGYGGGDLSQSRLPKVSVALDAALADLEVSRAEFGKLPSNLQLPPSVSERLSTLSAEKRALLNDFLSQTLLELRAQLKRNPADLYSVSLDRLYVLENGNSLPVAAKTEIGPSGPIIIFADAARELSSVELMALVGHELGHKVKFNGVYPGDQERVGPFSTGREILDVFGAALASHAQQLAVRPGGGSVGTSDRRAVTINGTVRELGVSPPAGTKSADAGSVEVELVLEKDSVVEISGSVSALHRAPFAKNAGVKALLLIDGAETRMRTDSFESRSIASQFSANVGFIGSLQAGVHKIKVLDFFEGKYPVGEYSQRQAMVSYRVFAAPGVAGSVVGSVGYTSSDSKRVQKTIVIDRPVVIKVFGGVSAKVGSSDITSGGIAASLRIDGLECGADSFVENYVQYYTYGVQAGCVQRLLPGVHELSVEDVFNYGAMQKYFAELQWMTIEANSLPNSGGAFVQTVNSNEGSSTFDFTNSEPVVIFVNATLSGRRDSSAVGPVVQHAALMVDGQTCSKKAFFKSAIASTLSKLNTSCVVTVPAGSHSIRVADLLNNSTNLSELRTKISVEVLAKR